MPSPQPHLAALAGLVPADWDAAAVEGLDRWKQGDLFPLLPLVWVTLPGLDYVTGVEEAGLPGEVITVETSALAWGIVTSQTCDITATGPGRLHPLVQASPVISSEEVPVETAEAITRGDFTYLAPLWPPLLGRLYIADLRISIPVSKAVLLAHEPVEGFETEAQRLSFATRVATKFERPAVHGFVSEKMIEIIRQNIKGSRKRRDTSWWTPVYEIRVGMSPDRLRPTRIDLHVVGRRELSPSEQQEWLSVVAALRTEAAKLTPKIEVSNPTHWTASNLTAAVYRNSVQLGIEELRTPPDPA